MPERIARLVADAVGDEVMVIVTEVDRQGRVNLSRRQAMQRHKATPRD